MSTGEFALPVHGWISPLPESARKEIAGKFPTLSIESVEGVYKNYLLFRDSSKHHPDPEKARKLLTKAQQQAKELCQTIEELGPLNFLTRQIIQSLAPDHLAEIDRLKSHAHGRRDGVSTRCRWNSKGSKGVGSDPSGSHAGCVYRGRQHSCRCNRRRSLSIVTAILLEAAGEEPNSAAAAVRGAYGNRKRTNPPGR